ncbi:MULTISPECIES: hypothetical protein [unclassified Janthinobacterium]|uniref:hypothetical protein n=1 Tax=unclassified Janthinobacterium TaxID=2610881 RepID=UPI001E5CF685|nr:MULTISPECIES: hypothetical protein [unclassified Janthinobacterium]MCC7642041.1 hypothetical protein [Janthinobacterium sp. EB271-G4-3-1]MCC7690167.1 hypothetical protein [Janthinobacterium sp. EB271-G4-3-2]
MKLNAQSCRTEAPAQVLAEPSEVFYLQGNLAVLICHAGKSMSAFGINGWMVVEAARHRKKPAAPAWLVAMVGRIGMLN